MGGDVLFLRAYPIDRPVIRASEVDHFYYGSIGSDKSSGLPVEIMRVLPRLFPQHLPAGAPPDWTAFGFIQEPGEVLPIGFSIRNQFVERTQINCGTCHTGTVRTAADAEPVIIPGMPAITVDLHGFFQFLFDVARDDGFTGDRVVEAIEENTDLNWLDRLIYRIAVDQMRELLQAREIRNEFIFADDYTRFLPGRVNTFDTFKVEQFRHFYAAEGTVPTRDEMFGIVDFPSVWNQAPRDGLWLHWDGNQSSVRERNFSAAMGAGTLPHEMDIAALFRIEAYLADLPAPTYPSRWTRRWRPGARPSTPRTAPIATISARPWSARPSRWTRSAPTRTGHGPIRTPSAAHRSTLRQDISGSSGTSAKSTAMRPSRWTGSGHGHPTCTTARCRRCGNC